MTGNMSNLDRLLRIIVGFGMVVVGFMLEGNAACLLGWLGLIPLLTGLVGTCPMYSFFGLNSKVCCR